jgi:hypothetical protein
MKLLFEDGRLMCTNLQEAGRRKWMSKEEETKILVRADTCKYMHIWTVSIQILLFSI